MNSDEIIFQQYKLYVEQKEKFVDRSFHTNKFYLVLLIALVLIMFMTKEHTFAYGLTSTLIFSAAGMAICVLWWINMDSYNFLIKIKLAKVVEEIEKKLPVQPSAMEYEAICEWKKNKKMFVFSDMQKTFAIIALLMFFVLFANEIFAIIFG